MKLSRMIYWLTFTAWVSLFVALAAPAWLAKAEIMRSATVEQKINAQTTAFQSAAPLLYLTLALTAVSLIAVALTQPKRSVKRTQVTNSVSFGQRLCEEAAHQANIRKLKGILKIVD